MTTELKNRFADMSAGEVADLLENGGVLIDEITALCRRNIELLRQAESEPSKSEPVAYGDRLGTYYASVHIAPKGALPQWMQHMTPLYSAPPSAQTGAQDHIAQASKMVTQSTYQPDVSIKAGEIDLSDAEIVVAVHAIGGTGRVSLTFTNNDGEEKPTIIVKDLIRALLAAKGGE